MHVLSSAINNATLATLLVALVAGVFTLFRGRIDGRVAVRIAEEAQANARRTDFYSRLESDNARLRAEVERAQAEMERYKRVIVKRDAVWAAMGTSYPEVLIREHSRYVRARRRHPSGDGLDGAVQSILHEAGVDQADAGSLDVLKVISAEEGPLP